MPIQFLCPACSKPLSTARRKAGRAIVCPCCEEAIIVPRDAKTSSRHPKTPKPDANELDENLANENSQEVEAPPVVRALPVPPPMVVPVPTVLPVSDGANPPQNPETTSPLPDGSEAEELVAQMMRITPDELEASSEDSSAHGAEVVSSAHDASDEGVAETNEPSYPFGADSLEGSGLSFSISPQLAQDRRESKREHLPKAPQGMILYDRDVLYLQAVLFFVITAAMFIGGFVWGRYSSPGFGEADPNGAGVAPEDGFLVLGRLRYESSGMPVPDQGAVAIFIPANASQSALISGDGLRPQDPPPGPNTKGLQQIVELGGVYVKADAVGEFTIVLPRTGDYHVLLISNGVRRETGQSIPTTYVNSMNGVFANSEHLITDRKYYWKVNSFRTGNDSIDHNFGPSGSGFNNTQPPIDDILNDLEQEAAEEESVEEESDEN